mmetsp:Transcript_10008/g.24939  ORF Transcript_10008/g.24939 Transcript_10008/m.24939 type:complete len:240 (+) Transcript_10008:3-722(+)
MFCTLFFFFRYGQYAESAQANAGVRMCFSFADRDKEGVVLQLGWFDSAKDYVAQPESLTACYSSGGDDDYTAVFGEYDSNVVAKIQALGGSCSFNDGMGGYIRDPKGAADADAPAVDMAAAFKTGQMPMIWLSKRKIKTGLLEQAKISFQKGVNRMFNNAPTAIAICEFEVPHESDTLWSLRVFNSFEGFKRHFPVPSAILFRMVFNVVPTWEAFPIGFSFSAPESIQGAIAANPGNNL